MDETQWTAHEAALLTPYVTNLNEPIFGLRNLPEVVKGALFSRYSRSEKSLRRILLDEFMQADEADFARIAGNQSTEQLIAVQQAEAFYDRVLIGYGDDSVAELGGAHVACEAISNVAAKALEDSRIGIDPLEKSTRYVAFNQQINGQYQYYREPEIMASAHAKRYEATLDQLFDTYNRLLGPVQTWVQSQVPRDAQTSARAYASATKAKTLDLLRGLLPMATLTNVGLYGNGRAFEYLLTKLRATALTELHTLADALQQQLDQLIPSFVKRAKTERGIKYQQYLAATRSNSATHAVTHTADLRLHPSPMVWLADYDRDAEVKLVAAILYPHCDLPLEQVINVARVMPPNERLDLLKMAVGDRESRFHRPGRAFEEVYYHFDLFADIGTYRDLHRHRMLTQDRQRYTTRHGYTTPPELVHAGVAGEYCAALDAAAATFEAISVDFPNAAQYVVPFAYRIRWRMKLNLREAYHLIELRSAPQGHPGYRSVAQEMYRQIRAVHPTLAEGIQFVDLGDYALERLDAERRFDAKIERNAGGKR